MTTALICPSAVTCAAAPASSSCTWALSAFIGGRSRRMVPTTPSVCTRTNSLTTDLQRGQREAEDVSGFDVLPAVNDGDSFRAAHAAPGGFLFHRPVPAMALVLSGLHRRLASPPARRRG